MTDSNTPRSTFVVGSDLQVAFKGQEDNQKCAVDQWAIKFAGKYFLANLILPHAAPEGALWLLGSIAEYRSSPVWGFKDDKRVKAGFQGRAFPLVMNELTYLVYTTQGAKPRVAHVVPLREILAQHEIEQSLDVALARKREAANLLGYDVDYTTAEAAWNKYQAEQARAEDEARRAEEEERREAERQVKVRAILARKPHRVFAGGQWVEEIPVLEGEWQMLPPKTKVVLVKKREDGLYDAIETFTVFKDFQKKGSEPQKSYVKPVGEAPTASLSAPALPAPVAQKIVIFEGKPFEVPTFGKREDVEAHRKAGLNSGSLRGVITTGGIDLFRVRKDGLEQVAAEAYKLIG